MIKESNKTKNIRNTLRKLAKGGNVAVRVGWFEEQKHEKDIAIADIMRFNERGGVTWNGYNVPARPFMRPAKEENKADWGKFLKREIKDGLTNGDLNVKKTLGRLGMVIQGQIQEKIIEVQSPPLSEYTVKKRLQRYAGGNKKDLDQGTIAKPLIDTAIAINSIQSRVSQE